MFPHRVFTLQACMAVLTLIAMLLRPGIARAEIRFDVFLGYDGMIPSMGWFPVACEVLNDGPSFQATFELSGGRNQGEIRTLQVELPTGTLKRFIIPVHAPGIYLRNFNARLLDSRGKVRAEANNLAVRNSESWDWQIPLSASVGNWMPALPDIESKRNNSSNKPTVARILPALFPDNPIALSGLDTIYLNSERALNLNPPQARALEDWLHQGGHLVVSVNQSLDFNGSPWLAALLPCSLAGMTTVSNQTALHQWLVGDEDIHGLKMLFQKSTRSPPRRSGNSRNPDPPSNSPDFENPYADLSPNPAFEHAVMETAKATMRDGTALVGTTAQPLIAIAQRGRGQITLLNFNPEMKPFADWPHRHLFWSKIVRMPPEVLLKDSSFSRAYQSIDGVFGAMVDSRQIRKLPIGWLLLILVAYLLVIGPLDRYWLKKINRQMLTWLTFPAYVALFSLLIYFIGYKLRAGETEWNEIHLVDVLPGLTPAQSRLQGITYGSLYSPANARYTLALEKPFAAFRGEYGTGDPGRSVIQQKGDGFTAVASVPVWTSQLFTTRWWRNQQPPLTVSLSTLNNAPAATVANHLNVDLTDVRWVHGERILEFGPIAAGETSTFPLDTPGRNLASFVQTTATSFDPAINARRNALGGNSWSQIQNFTNAAIAACFLEESLIRKYLMPPGLDLSPDLKRGNGILLAWASDYSPIEPLNQFKPRRHHRETLWRIVVPMTPQPSP